MGDKSDDGEKNDAGDKNGAAAAYLGVRSLLTGS